MRTAALFVFFFLSLFGSCSAETLYETGNNRFLIGPEAYHVYRTRDGGTHQKGWLFGVRAIYDHIQRCGLYWACEGSYAGGLLYGSSKPKRFHKETKQSLQSTYYEATGEGRIGFTFQATSGHRPSFTPFIGYGYFWENNKFGGCSPLHLRFKTDYQYSTAGFLSSITLCGNWRLGLNLKVRYMIDPKCTVSNDPDYTQIRLKIGNDRLQYRVELPLNYLASCYCGFSFIPFYEERCYGGQNGCPFDFIRTRYYNCGATTALFYSF